MSQNPGIGTSATVSGTVNTKNVLTGSSPTYATVGVTSSQVIVSNSSRKGLVLVNLSTNNISFGIGSNPAVVGSGITLTPNGVWVMDEYTFTTSAINGIATGAGSNLAINEFV